MIDALQYAVGRVVLLQADPGFDVDVSIGEGLTGGALSAFLTTLLVGAILVAVAPAFTERVMATVADDPLETLVYGLLSAIVVGVLAVLLAFTFVGIALAIPLVVAAYVLWAAGAAIAFLAIAIRLVDREDGWAKPLVVAAVLNGGLTLTGIGGLVAFVVGLAGFGAVLQEVLG